MIAGQVTCSSNSSAIQNLSDTSLVPCYILIMKFFQGAKWNFDKQPRRNYKQPHRPVLFVICRLWKIPNWDVAGLFVGVVLNLQTTPQGCLSVLFWQKQPREFTNNTDKQPCCTYVWLTTNAFWPRPTLFDQDRQTRQRQNCAIWPRPSAFAHDRANLAKARFRIWPRPSHLGQDQPGLVRRRPGCWSWGPAHIWGGPCCLHRQKFPFRDVTLH